MIAVYPGSFDPVTSGHYDIIARAAGMFEMLVVLVAVNSGKTPLFTADERAALIREACASLPNVQVDTLTDALLVDYAVGRGAKVIVKGLRAVSDFEVEFQMALLNRHLQPEVETLFLMTSAEHSYLSSSIVKEIGRLGGDITGLVPEVVVPALRQKFAQTHPST
ncbi:MAG: pantetheine-phosphate adenylyltransferase [Armatimonadota bacterium]|nr:pantetheine-phosphate adenylyltransferase [Armatimonadota bacterium]